jgi:DNA-binding transcriptional MerR regulator
MQGDNTKNGFSVAEAARLSGLSATMVEYLCRTAVLRPSASPPRGRGRRRMYSFLDVVILRVIARLLKNGVSISGMRSAFTGLRKRHPEIADSSLAGALLVTDGKRVFLKQGREVIEDLSGGQLAFAFVVELGGIRRDVAVQVNSVRNTGRASKRGLAL